MIAGRLSLLAAAAVLAGASGASAATLSAEFAVDGQGRASQAWIDALADELSPADAKKLGEEPRPLDDDEMAWAAIVVGEVQRWDKRRAELDALFESADRPGRVLVLVGNRGARDAFTAGDRTIGVNVRRFKELYGTPSAENTERFRRILAHEYSHLCLRAWRRNHRVETDTPLARAEWTLFSEGLGHYFSLADKWRPSAGKPSTAAALALAEHNPVLVERLAALAKGPDEAAERTLVEGMATGTFDKKWGVLPVALWLAAEVAEQGEQKALQAYVAAGPTGVLALAGRHLPPELVQQLPGRRPRVKPPTVVVPELAAPEEKSALDRMRDSSPE